MNSPGDTSPPKIRTIRTDGRRNGPLRTDVRVRDFDFVIDEPEKLGGSDLAPTPMEYVTGALGGCFTVTIELVAKELAFDLADIRVVCEGFIDQRGFFGTAAVSPHFQRVAVDIHIRSPESADRRAELERATLRRCPVFNLINDSGAAVDVNWHYDKGPDSQRDAAPRPDNEVA